MIEYIYIASFNQGIKRHKVLSVDQYGYRYVDSRYDLFDVHRVIPKSGTEGNKPFETFEAAKKWLTFQSGVTLDMLTARLTEQTKLHRTFEDMREEDTHNE